MNKKEQTIESYNRNARAHAKKFDDLGAGIRRGDVEETFVLVKKSNPYVLEIGCGSGRDAVEITKHTNNYLGIDISEKLIELARQKLPKSQFRVADIEDYDFPKNIDIIFAFASLIHVPKESLRRILDKAHSALNNSGVVRLSMKYSDYYRELIRNDEFGTRAYYLYSRNDIEELSDSFEIIKKDVIDLRGQKWLEIILKK